MFEFKKIENLSLQELFSELGMADYTYIETSTFLEQLEVYREKIHNQIKEIQNVAGKSLDQDKST